MNLYEECVHIGKIICLEGNISAGKTTLTKQLGNLINYKVYLEPTISNPYLSLFYQNPKKYALKMQLWLLRQRFLTYMEAVKYNYTTGKGVILDRSIFSDWVFAERGRLDENISPEGFISYMNLRESMLEKLPKPDLVIYVDVLPKECYRRIAIRARECETTIPLVYLEGLHDCYEKLINNMQKESINVERLNWNNFGDTSAVVELLSKSSVTQNTELFNINSFNDREVANMLRLSEGEQYVFGSNMENIVEAIRDHTFRDVDGA